jgi:hypothetical protein
MMTLAGLLKILQRIQRAVSKVNKTTKAEVTISAETNMHYPTVFGVTSS